MYVAWGDFCWTIIIIWFLFLADLYIIHSKLPGGNKTMYLPINMDKRTKTYFLLLYFDIFSTCMSSVPEDAVKKVRMCMQYKINDYKSSARRCDAFTSVSMTACFMQCTRHQKCFCKAFQFDSRDGLCEILEKEECMAENNTPGVVFVGVRKCQSIPPWKSTEPANGKWRWVTHPPTRKGSVRLSSPGGAVRYVARAFHEGLFLAGYTINSRLTTGKPSGGHLLCESNIQFLIFEKLSDYRWKNFYVGDPIPSKAIVSGYWKDGAPLYIVRSSERPYGTLKAHAYNAKSLRLFPRKYKNMAPEMKILIAE